MKRMKKHHLLQAAALAAALALALGVAPAFASDGQGVQNELHQLRLHIADAQQECNFVDDDGDGVCDLKTTCEGCWRSYADAARNGLEKAAGICRGGQGAFIDEDGDGICDNRGEGGNGYGRGAGPRDGSGYGYGYGHGSGYGYGYGNCDESGNGQHDGTGEHHGHGNWR